MVSNFAFDLNIPHLIMFHDEQFGNVPNMFTYPSRYFTNRGEKVGEENDTSCQGGTFEH